MESAVILPALLIVVLAVWCLILKSRLEWSNILHEAAINELIKRDERIGLLEIRILELMAEHLPLSSQPAQADVLKIEAGKVIPETELSKYLCAPVDTPQRIADLYYKCHPELRFHEFWLEHTKTNRLDKELYDFNPDDHTLTKIDHRTPAEKAAGNMCVG